MTDVDETHPLLKGIAEIICQAIAVNATKDKQWVVKKQIEKFFQEYTEFDMTKVHRLLESALDSLVRRNTLKCKRKSYKFVSRSTKDDGTPISPPKKRQFKLRASQGTEGARQKPTPPKAKRQPPAEKQMGPNVGTASERVSYRPKWL
jgi:hypothetical protein